MANATALAEIKRLAALDRIRIRRHAQRRMRERGADRGDVRRALLTATSATWQFDHETWRVSGGVDLRGDALVCVVDLEADVVIITVF